MFGRIGFLRLVILLGAVLFAFTGCQTTYYNTMEKFGVHKRDIMVDRRDDFRRGSSLGTGGRRHDG